MLLASPTYCVSRFAYERRRTREVQIGNVAVGGNQPIVVQSMTTTRTQDIDGTLAQTIRLVEAGCQIVRITAPTANDARAIGEIKRRLRAQGIDVPLVADIHFSPAAAMEAAEYVDKVRVNPGNFADQKFFRVREYSDEDYAAEIERIEERFAPLVLKCKQRGVAMRIGSNHGSLSDRIMNRYGDTPAGMVESALEFVRIARKHDFNDIVLIWKASDKLTLTTEANLVRDDFGARGFTGKPSPSNAFGIAQYVGYALTDQVTLNGSRDDRRVVAEQEPKPEKGGYQDALADHDQPVNALATV